MIVLGVEEFVRGDAGLFQDGTQCPFRQIPGVVWERSVAVRFGVKPDFVAAGSLAIKTETKRSDTPHDLAVPKACEAAQSGSHDDPEIVALLAGRQGGWPLPLAACFNEFTGHVPRDLQSFSDGSALGDQPRKLLGSGQVNPLGKPLYMDLNREFHLDQG